MARRVDEVELVCETVRSGVVEAHRLRLDGDAALALEVEGVEQLVLHIAHRHRPGPLQQAIGERRLAVVDVGDDAEVADQVEWLAGHGAPL